MKADQLSPNYLAASIMLIIGLLVIFTKQGIPDWLFYTVMPASLIFLKPVFDGWLRPIWLLLLSLSALLLLLEVLIFIIK